MNFIFLFKEANRLLRLSVYNVKARMHIKEIMERGMNMGTAVILVVLVIIVVFAVRSGIKHGKGEGGCCGGGGSVKEEKKVLTGDIIATKIVSIEGMHCENCKNSIEHQINRIDGASCEVNLKKKIAIIKMDKPVDDDTIRRTIERLDFKVLDIKNA